MLAIIPTMMLVGQLSIVAHWVHILAAVMAIGGAVFLRHLLIPSAEATLAAEQHDALRAHLMRRWKIVVMVCITLLLVTGLYTTLAVICERAKAATNYYAILGVKLTLALGVFFIASALTGRAAVFAPMRAKAKLWLNVIIALGAGTILLGAILASLGRH